MECTRFFIRNFILSELKSRTKYLEHSKEVEQNYSKIIALVIKALVEIFLIKMGHATQLIPVVISTFRVFQIVIESEMEGKGGRVGREFSPVGGGIRNFTGRDFFYRAKET